MSKRILIRNHGPCRENVVRALALAVKNATDTEAPLIHLIVPSKSSFSGGVISEALGESATAFLLKGKAVPVRDKISIKLESTDTCKNLYEAKIILAAYLDGRDMRTVERLNALCIIFLPWISEEGEGWQASWNAEVLGEKLKEDDLKLHPILEEKLKSLSVRINLSTGLSHPLDLKTANDMFRDLNGEGVEYEPKDLRSWACRNGWRPDFAQDLYELAEKAHSR